MRTLLMFCLALIGVGWAMNDLARTNQQSRTTPHPPAEPLSEYYKQELTHSLNRIDDLEKIRLQLAALLGTANLTAIGIAFNRTLVGPFFIAIAILLVFWVLDVQARRLQIRFYFRSLQLQRRFRDPGDFETTVELHTSKMAVAVRKILDAYPGEHQVPERMQALDKSRVHVKGIFFWVPYLTLIAEIVVAFFLLIISRWPLF